MTQIIKAKPLVTGLALALLPLLAGPAYAGSGSDHGQCDREGRDSMSSSKYGSEGKFSPAKVDKRMAKLKNALEITTEQESAWSSFESVLRNGMKQRQERRKTRASNANLNAVEKLDHHVAHLEARLEHMKSMQNALANLYAVLDSNQQAVADTLLPRKHHKRNKG